MASAEKKSPAAIKLQGFFIYGAEGLTRTGTGVATTLQERIIMISILGAFELTITKKIRTY
jgi:hypothetical protein